MASGVAHHKINLLALLGILATASLYGLPHHDLVGIGLGGAVSTLLLSPDLDLRQSISSRAWGLMSVVWLPYHRLFRHRQLSHWPLVGTMTRLIYLWLVAEVLGQTLLTLWSLPDHGELLPAFQEATTQLHHHKLDILAAIDEHPRLSLAFFGGLVAGDLLHLVVDWVTSLYRRFL